jgi:hypothetical protein
MASDTNSEPAPASDLDTILGDIASLKRDLAALATHLRQSAKGSISGATGQLGEEAARAYENLAAEGQRSAKIVAAHVEEKPLLWLLGAFAVGFVGGRILSR